MSADNTIIVLRTPSPGAETTTTTLYDFATYRVAVVQAAENLESDSPPEYLAWLMAECFGKSTVYNCEQDAWRAALAMAADMEANEQYLEYGVKSVRMQQAYPAETIAALRQVLKQKKIFPFDR